MPLSRKCPPGLAFIASLLLNWKLVSLPVVLLAIFKPSFWPATLIFLTALPLSVVALVCLQNLRHVRRQTELGAELPPPIPTKSVGGLDLLKEFRWEYHFGYLGDCYSGS